MLWNLLVTLALLQQPNSNSAPATQPQDPTAKVAPPVETNVKPTLDIKATISPTEVKLGETAILEITATHDKNLRLYFPASPELKPFRTEGKITGPERAIVGDNVVEKWQVPIYALRLGRRKIPPFTIDYEDPNAETGQVKTPPVAINVIPRLDPADKSAAQVTNDPPLALLDTNWTLILFLIGLGVVTVTAIITLIAVRYVASLPKRGPPAPPPRPAHEVAEEKLKALKTERLLETSEFKQFTFRLSEILREYLGLRYAVETLELTTSELLTKIKRLGPEGLSIYELEAFLQSTDLVKFANLTPAYSDATGNLDTCERMIESTRRSDQEVASLLESEKRKRLLEKAAHPFKRTFALMIDLLAYAVFSTALVLGARWLEASWLYWVDGLLFISFVLLRDSYGPGSPGKVLSGLALTPLNSPDSKRLPFSARILRNIPLLLPVAGHTMEFVVMTYAADGRRVGDRWAQARVLDRRPESSERAFLLYSLAAALAIVAIGWLIPFVWMGS